MPYTIIKKNNQYELYLNKNNQLLGIHKTKKEANDQIKAIEINKTGRTDNNLWELSKEEAIKRMGEHSARAMQLAGKIYRDLGGKYTKNKTKSQQDLTDWTNEEWTTKSGLDSKILNERYLPKKIINNLTNKEYDKTSLYKQLGTVEGKQYVKQPKEIIEKIKQLKGNGKKDYKIIDGLKYFISDKPNKKLMVIIDGKKVYFGQYGYQHYKDRTNLLNPELNHLNKERRQRYLKRATKIKNKEGDYTVDDINSPNYHAIRILW